MVKTQDGKPGPGWYWVGQDTQGVNKWSNQAPASGGTDTSGSTSGGSSGGYSGGSGGSARAGAAEEGLSPYIQAYRVYIDPKGTPDAALVATAKAGKWSTTLFLQQVRLTDKNYWKTPDARDNLVQFTRTMKVLFPALAKKERQSALMKSPFYKKTALWYLKNGIGQKANSEERLYSHLTNTRQWRKANPYWKDYARNKNIGVVATANPLLYKSYLDTLKQSFTQYGLELPEDYYRSFFRGRYASEQGMSDLQENLKGFSQSAGALSWWQGEKPTKAQTKQAILGEDMAATDLRSRLAKAFATQQSFFSGKQQPFQTSLNERNQLVQPLI